jgi:hypothetical protein
MADKKVVKKALENVGVHIDFEIKKAKNGVEFLLFHVWSPDPAWAKVQGIAAQNKLIADVVNGVCWAKANAK